MIGILPGFRDFSPETCSIRNAIFSQWRSVAHAFGFEEFDGPVLEPIELFTKKSGEEIVEQLFSFEDKGGRSIALRPEMTPSLVRILGKNLATLKRPTKWFNITENFRYERPQKGRLRSFYQFNVDIVGEDSLAADAELIALAIRSFRAFCLTREHFYVRLSDRQLWMLWLQAFGIFDESSKLAMLSLFDKWERRSHEDIERDLCKILPDTVSSSKFFEMTESLRCAHSLEDIRVCFKTIKTSSDIDVAIESRLSEWSALLDELRRLQCDDFLTIDLGIVRGLAYYTGFVFEVFENNLQGRALAGGGRYDQLFEKLIGHAMPAVGFAAGDVTLTDLLQKTKKLPVVNHRLDAFVIFEPTERPVALRIAQLLREAGLRVVYVLNESKNLSKQLKKAFSENPKYILVFTHDEVQQGQVQLKHVDQNTTTLVAIEDLVHLLVEKRF